VQRTNKKNRFFNLKKKKKKKMELNAKTLASISVTMVIVAALATVFQHILSIRTAHMHNDRNTLVQSLHEQHLNNGGGEGGNRFDRGYEHYEHVRAKADAHVTFFHRSAKQWQGDATLALLAATAFGVLAMYAQKDAKVGAKAV
jgi:ABC-type nickel/cobalt efflux system permease component RcnA